MTPAELALICIVVVGMAGAYAIGVGNREPVEELPPMPPQALERVTLPVNNHWQWQQQPTPGKLRPERRKVQGRYRDSKGHFGPERRRTAANTSGAAKAGRTSGKRK